MLSRLGAAARLHAKQAPRLASAVPRTQARKFTPVTVSFAKKQQLPLFSSRCLHSSSSPSSAASSSDAKKQSPFDNVDAARAVELGSQIVSKVQAASTQQLFHWTSYGLAGMAPVALILSPSFLCFPVDFALGLVLPLHMHIGLVNVVEDYVPRPQQGLARAALAVLSVLTAIGLLKVNLCGAGITESVKSVWRKPKEAKQIKQ